jgi:hypothetical protein
MCIKIFKITGQILQIKANELLTNIANTDYREAITQERTFPCKVGFLDEKGKYCLYQQTGSSVSAKRCVVTEK